MGDEPTPFSLDEDQSDENEGGTEPKGEDNKSIQAIRGFAERAEKRALKAETEAESLRSQLQEFLVREKDQAVESVFKEVGLNPAHGELFKTVNADLDVEKITADAVKEFANRYQLPTGTGEVPDAPERAPSGFRPPPVSGVPTPAEKLTDKEIDSMLRDGDFDGVRKAFTDGRVETVEAPWPMDPNRRRA